LASATTSVPHPDPRSTIGPVPEFSAAAAIVRETLPELGEGEMPVFMDVNTIRIPAMVMHAIRMISIINIMSGILDEPGGYIHLIPLVAALSSFNISLIVSTLILFVNRILLMNAGSSTMFIRSVF